MTLGTELSAALIVLTLASSSTLAQQPEAAVVELRCEYVLKPQTISNPIPRFGWRIEAKQSGYEQVAYQLLVASSPELLGQDKGDLWDSGEAPGNRSQFVTFGGDPLKTDQVVHWKVRSKGANRKYTAWSGAASFKVDLTQGPALPKPIFPANTPVLSSIETSDPNLNKLFAAAPDALAKIDNLRDAALTVRAASFLNPLANPNAEQWFVRLNEAANAGGFYPASLPSKGTFISTFSDAPIWLIHSVRLTTGDSTTLRKYWPTMMAYFNVRKRRDPDANGKAMGKLPADTLPAGDRTPKALIHLVSQAFNVRLMHEMVRPATNSPFPVLKLRQAFSSLSEGFKKNFVNQEGALKHRTLTAHLLALRSGLISEDETIKKRIIADTLKLLDAPKTSPFAQGPLAAQSVLPILTFTGNIDQAVKLASAQDPEKLTPVALASISEWLISMVAGIDSEALGFQHIRLAPQIPSPEVLKFAKAHFDTFHGRVSIHWRHEDGALLYDATIPSNTTVLFMLPAQKDQKIFEGGTPISESKRFSKFGRGENSAALRAGPGSYSFKITD
jgi:hypothetical protein